MILLIAAGLLSVLEPHNKLQGADKSAVDASYLADRVRAEVLDEHLGVQVMTRENMLVLLGAQGKTLESCEGECEVDTGRRLGADYVISGELLRVGTQLKLSLKLHETKNGTLLGATTASGADVDALDAGLPASVKRLTEALRPQQTAQAAPEPAPQPVRHDDPGSIDMKVDAPADGKWLLQTNEGATVCTLPCDRKLSLRYTYYAEKDAPLTADRERVAVPTAEFSPGTSAKAVFVPSRGSSTAGIVLATIGLAAGAAGVGLISAEHPADSTSVSGGGTGVGVGGGATTPDPMLANGVAIGGAALAVVGVVLLIISHDAHYDSLLR